MIEDESRTDRDGRSESDEGDLVFKELTRLREVGLNDQNADGSGFPRLRKIAEAIWPPGEELKPLRYAVREAANRRGGDEGEGLKLLFGVEETFKTSYPHRRKKARELLVRSDELPPKKLSDDSFKRRWMKPLTETLAGQFHALDKAPSRHRTDSGRTLRSRAIPVAVAGLSVAVLTCGVAFWLLLRGADSSGSSFPRGAAVNARTGALVRHPVLRPSQRVKLWEPGLFRGCNLSADAHCPVLNDAPIAARIGDTLKFIITLQSEAPEPLPYAKLSFGGVHPLSRPTFETEASMQLVWPTHSQQESREKRLVAIQIVRLPRGSGPGALRIVPGSAVLLNPRQHVVAHLSDSLNSPQGVALTEIGIPKSCFFNCRVNYIRYIEVRAKLVHSAYEFQ